MSIASFHIPGLRLSGGASTSRWPTRLAAAVTVFALCLGSAKAADDYRIGPGDTLAVTVVGQPDVSGRFRVGPDGAISLPMAGSIAVGDLTPTQVRDRINEALRGKVALTSGSGVEVAEYAPVFVAGDVDRPGQFQYRPGMLALELVALGGGVRRTETPAGTNAALQIIAAQESLFLMRLQRFTLGVTRLRLEAEVNDRDFQPPVVDPGLSIDPTAQKRVIDNEVALFNVRRSIYEGRSKGLAAQRASYNDEIGSLTKSIELQSGEVASLQQETDIAQDMMERGVTAKTRLLAMQREVSSMKRNALELQSYLARARQNLLSIEYQIAELRNVRVNEASEAIRTLDNDAAGVDKKIESTVRSMAEFGAQAPTSNAETVIARLSVIRQVNGTVQEQPIDELAQIRPRDILRVRRDFSGPPANAAPRVETLPEDPTASLKPRT